MESWVLTNCCLTASPQNNLSACTNRSSGAGRGLFEWLVAPAPPGVLAVDVQQELWHRMSAGVVKGDGAADVLVRGFPRAEVIIDVIERAQILLEQRPDLLEHRRRPDCRVEPGKVTAGNDEVGDDLLTAPYLPHLLVIAHGISLRPLTSGWRSLVCWRAARAV